MKLTTMKSVNNWLLPILTVLLLVSCKKFEGEDRVPAFIRLDALDVCQQASNAPSTRAGWYTYDIDAVQLTCFFEGDKSEVTLGVFQLPCQVPVLDHRTISRLTVTPVIKQNGISATRIYYPYFKTIELTDIPLTPGKTTCIGTPDTNGRYSIPVYYQDGKRIDEKFFADFEHLFSDSLPFTCQDSLVFLKELDPEGACTGSGYLRVVTPDSVDGITFQLTTPITEPDATKLLYLEMDYRTDVYLQIGMHSAYVNGGNKETLQVMTLYPTKEWKKIYINLGKLWAYFNYHPEFKLVFSTLNTTEVGGETMLDNIKVIAY